jgi:hypothetical protein
MKQYEGIATVFETVRKILGNFANLDCWSVKLCTGFEMRSPKFLYPSFSVIPQFAIKNVKPMCCGRMARVEM